MKKRCVACTKLTEKWQRYNGGPWRCYDGCYSTTGWDRRARNGKPLWEMSAEERVREEIKS